MKPQLIFLGAPGSGKGTQAKILASKFDYNHISTGDLLRLEVNRGSEVGIEVSKILKEGGLVSDDKVLQLVKKNCDLTNNKYIFDGFPRNLNQAIALEEKILKDNPFYIIYFHIDMDLLLDRLENRLSCSSCGMIFNKKTSPPKVERICDNCGSSIDIRNDDKKEVAQVRFKLFESSIYPILDYYKQKDNFFRLDASEDIEVLAGKVYEVINK